MSSYPKYRSRFHPIDEDEVWSKQNYLIWKDKDSRLAHARHPFYINVRDKPIPGFDGDTQQPNRLIHIFSPAGVQFVYSMLTRLLPKRQSTLARRFDSMGYWPEPKRPGDRGSQGLIALHTASDFMLGLAVINILEWHGVLVHSVADDDLRMENPLLQLDQRALDTWAVTATLIAEN